MAASTASGEWPLALIRKAIMASIDEWLMREKDGKNIGLILGESNLKDIDNSFGIYGSWDGQGIDIGAIGISERYRLVPVPLEEMENLPPEFPHHLLRGWQ